MDVEFPTARRASVMFIRDHQLMLWGGMTQIILGEGGERLIIDVDLPNPDSNETALEVFDLDTFLWKKEETTGNVPRMAQGSSFAVVGDSLYVYGGMNDEDYFDGFYKLNLEGEFNWTKLQASDGPTAKGFGAMVAAGGENLVTFGGVGNRLLKESKHGAKFVADKSFNHEFGSGWNNALHEYNIKSGLWREVNCGARPFPCEKLTLNRIDKHRALMFGGKQEKYSAGSREVFFLDLDSLTWDGPYGPTSPDQKWPGARGLHSCACLVDPDSDLAEAEQRLAVFWGEGLEARILSDVWVLTIMGTGMEWKELKIPLRPRKYHMSCSHHIKERQTDLFLYGGNKQRKSVLERHVMTGLTIFHFGSVRTLQQSCLEIVKSNWDFYGQIQLPQHILSMLGTGAIEDTDGGTPLSVYPLEKDFH